MTNGVSRAEFWKTFILQRCGFPKPELLAAQFDHAELADFCECGCNSFAVRVRSDSNVPPLAAIDDYGLVFEADFNLREDEKTLEILLFAGGSGHLEYVEIDCCANAYPVPEEFQVQGPPYHVFSHESLAP